MNDKLPSFKVTLAFSSVDDEKQNLQLEGCWGETFNLTAESLAVS